MDFGKIEVIIFDIDGTLVHKKDSISARLIKQINILKKSGYKVGIATGRSIAESGSIIDQIKPNFPCIFADGQLAYDIEKKEVLFKKSLPLDKIELIKVYLNDDYHVIQEDENYIYAENRLAEIRFSMAFGVNRKFISNTKAEDSILPIRMYITAKQHKKFISSDIEEKIIMMSEKWIKVYRAGENWIILSLSQKDKVDALNAICKKLKLKTSNILAFGDGCNDINLFKSVGISIAMQGANQTVKRYVDLVTNDDTTNSISKILDNLQLYY
ncbi:Cof-type HAD-IIB family hydrolase [Clostridium cibarium]|uniref:Cof-type HAD-IIB family hydrolase n=1 Tax=Clostridium cibarium TaxID=2762247 RepID=A0ABR8PY16_9CLOT|nr:Cof-type HAD-IIB family hydrolase [Clostridium cibarium]MBD7913052.1 Cof-type HAD-IIB family hydrolase [Clostridium cibarium]